MASVTCWLTAEDRDQLRNPTLVSSMGLHMPLPVMHEVCVQHFKLCEFVFHVLCGSGKNVKINIIFCCLFVINAQYLYWYFYLNLMHWYC